MALLSMRRRFSKLKLWAAVAIPLVVVLAAVYGFLGYTYYIGSRALSTTESQIDTLRAGIRGEIPDFDKLQEELEHRQEMLQEWTKVFTYPGYPDPQRLHAIVTETALEAGVNVTSLSSVETESTDDEHFVYQTPSLILEVASEVSKDIYDIYDFLDLLREKTPYVQVEDIAFAHVTAIPSATIRLRFFVLAPTPTPEPEEVSAE